MSAIVTAIVAEVITEAGRIVVRDVLSDHLQAVKAARRGYTISDLDLLSASVDSATNLPVEVRYRIHSLKDQIRFVIEEAARQIEVYKYKSSEEAMSRVELPLKQRQDWNDLAESSKEVRISFKSLEIVVDIFSKLNQEIIEQLEPAEYGESTVDVQRERDLLFTNAIIVSELTDFAVHYINQFQLNGKEGIKRLRRGKDREIEEIRQQQDGLRNRISDTGVEESVRRRIEANIEAREEAIKSLIEAWDLYEQEIVGIETEVTKLKGKLDTLEAIRDDAQIQIKLLQAATMMRIMKDGLDSFREIMKAFQGLELAEMSPDRMRRLLGITEQ